MTVRVDWEAVVADFEAFLLEDGRASHGTAHLTRKLAELRARHRVDEDADVRVLRRLGDELVDTLVGILPADSPATTGPLVAADRSCRCRAAGVDPTRPGLRCVNARPTGCALEMTAVAMDGGAATDQPTEGSWKQLSRSREPATI